MCYLFPKRLGLFQGGLITIYYISKKLIELPTIVRQKEERDIPGPRDNLEGKSCLAGSSLVLWPCHGLGAPPAAPDTRTAWRSNQSILRETNSAYSPEGLMLKLQYFGQLMKRPDQGFQGSLEKILMLGRIESRKRRGWKRISRLDGITDSVDMNLSKLQETEKDREAQCSAVHGVKKSQAPLKNWRATTTWV